MQWYTEVLKKYAVFSGRARRKEYWMFVLVSTIVSIVLAILDGILNTQSDNGFGLLQGIYALAVLLPSLAVGVRRLHDTNRSGWWILIALTGIGLIVLIVFYAQEGNPGDNQYGPDPKAAERSPAAFPGGEPGYPQV
jgi:uncharacterized membrane protein YhaH (DUF805 family)